MVHPIPFSCIITAMFILLDFTYYFTFRYTYILFNSIFYNLHIISCSHHNASHYFNVTSFQTDFFQPRTGGSG
jgi:hypothetical protein